MTQPAPADYLAKPIVFYDGSCALCSRSVRWLVKRDPHARLRFAPLGGITFQKTYSPAEISAFPDSVIVRTSERKTLVRSATTVFLLRTIGGIWSLAAALLWLVPPPLRDAGYNFIQHRRHRWFGETDESCPVASAELRRRFLP